VIEPLNRDGYRMMQKDGMSKWSWTPQAGLKSVLD